MNIHHTRPHQNASYYCGRSKQAHHTDDEGQTHYYPVHCINTVEKRGTACYACTNALKRERSRGTCSLCHDDPTRYADGLCNRCSLRAPMNWFGESRFIIGCSAAKLPSLHTMPAELRYSKSTLFRLAHAYVRSCVPDYEAHMRIASACYGILEVRNPIYDYNLKLSDLDDDQLERWINVTSGYLSRWILPKVSDVVILAGKDYAEALTAAIQAFQPTTRIHLPLQSKGIPQRQKWLKQQLPPGTVACASCGFKHLAGIPEDPTTSDYWSRNPGDDHHCSDNLPDPTTQEQPEHRGPFSLRWTAEKGARARTAGCMFPDALADQPPKKPRKKKAKAK